MLILFWVKWRRTKSLRFRNTSLPWSLRQSQDGKASSSSSGTRRPASSSAGLAWAGVSIFLSFVCGNFSAVLLYRESSFTYVHVCGIFRTFIYKDLKNEYKYFLLENCVMIWKAKDIMHRHRWKENIPNNMKLCESVFVCLDVHGWINKSCSMFMIW